jgi:hypothetical protein
MDERHGSLGATHISGTLVGLVDLATVDVYLDRMLADETSEEA